MILAVNHHISEYGHQLSSGYLPAGLVDEKSLEFCLKALETLISHLEVSTLIPHHGSPALNTHRQ